MASWTRAPAAGGRSPTAARPIPMNGKPMPTNTLWRAMVRARLAAEMPAATRAVHDQYRDDRTGQELPQHECAGEREQRDDIDGEPPQQIGRVPDSRDGGGATRGEHGCGRRQQRVPDSGPPIHVGDRARSSGPEAAVTIRSTSQVDPGVSEDQRLLSLRLCGTTVAAGV